MQGDFPFYESPEDALRAAIQALGGAKVIGNLIWPDKSVETAANRLLDCTNSARAEKLEITQVMFILRKARDAGFHAPFLWLSNQLGYESRPVSQDEEEDRITHVIEMSAKTLAQSIEKLERLRQQPQIRVAK